MSQNMATQLQQENVIPDVLSEETALPYQLIAEWPNATLDIPGKHLDREATQSTPTVKLEPAPEEKGNVYTLIMTDPDLMARNDSNFGQVRHWFATNISVKTTGELNIPPEADYSPYVGPAPLPNYISPRPHRYVFILTRPRSTGPAVAAIQKEDLRELQNEYPAAFEGKQDLQDLKDRWGFHVQKFMDKNQLDAVAATFMMVGGTFKSAVDNVTMTAQAGLNKAMGN